MLIKRGKLAFVLVAFISFIIECSRYNYIIYTIYTATTTTIINYYVCVCMLEDSFGFVVLCFFTISMACPC